MLTISRLSVKNYRSIKDAEFHFTNYTPLVGYNNAGKSNVLKAIQWLVEYPALQVGDFNDTNLPVVVEAEIHGVSEGVLAALVDKHRDKVIPLVSEDGVFRVRRVQPDPTLSKSGIITEVLAPDEGADWAVPPTGIPQALTPLFPEVIFVGAMEDSAADVAKNSSGSTIGKLIKAIIAPIRDDFEDQIKDALAPIQAQLASNSEDKDERLIKVDEVIRQHLNEFFPDVVAKTHISMPDFGEITKNATLKVFENRYGDNRESDASSMGHGAQRSVQISLVNALAQIKREHGKADDRSILLLVDEPELYLHPQAIAVSRSAFKKLSGDGYQVAFSTHSSEMIGFGDVSNTLILRRTRENGTTSEACLKAKIQECIEEVDTQGEILFELSNSREFLFNDKVFLVEGNTEKALVPHLYEYFHNRSLAEDRIGLIPIGGANNFPNCRLILEAMGIESRCIADLDFLLKRGAETGLHGVADERRLAILDVCGLLNDNEQISCGDDGWPNKGKGMSAAQAIALVASHDDAVGPIGDLVAAAEAQGYFVWCKGTIETHLGLSGKKASHWKRFAEKLAAKDVDDVPDLDSAKRFLTF
ncbi:ATP-dependent nuclease [Aliiroseovarius sp. 2305UL8-7]|uniref:ATP-dependent nuclease n=1 Tax=Aliiroseovarius conchicola TaxID=3121637 RepID=UPI003529D2F5